ncbi:MAG: hypothetical protein L6Q99_09465 [Planctomycetes bacterium]|nr:hypothetical protein [Planctomycetota bacterium]
MRLSRRPAAWLVLVVAGVVLAMWLVRGFRAASEATTIGAPRATRATGATGSTRELVDLAEPDDARARAPAEPGASEPAPAAPSATSPTADSGDEALGGLEGTLWLAPELATHEWRIRVERVPKSALARTSSECTFTRTACLEFAFADLVPGWYTARVELVRRLPPRSPPEVNGNGNGNGAGDREGEVDAEGTGLAELLHVDYGLEVVGGESTRSPEWDPLDLRDAYRLARYVLVDEVGVPWRGAVVRSSTDAESEFTSVSDELGNVEIVVAAAATQVELTLRGADACAVETPFTSARSVVVVPRRPTYVLEIDPTLVPSDRWLGLSVQAVRVDGSESSVRTDRAYVEFEPGSGTVRLQPTRLGAHELQWLVKRQGRGTVFIDSPTRLDVQPRAEPVHVRLDLPEAVLAALR